MEITASMVKELREMTGLSQKAFGKKYHIPTRTVENWEGGQRSPSETIVYLLERAVKEDYKMKYKRILLKLISALSVIVCFAKCIHFACTKIFIPFTIDNPVIINFKTCIKHG